MSTALRSNQEIVESLNTLSQTSYALARSNQEIVESSPPLSGAAPTTSSKQSRDSRKFLKLKVFGVHLLLLKQSRDSRKDVNVAVSLRVTIPVTYTLSEAIKR